VTDPDPVGQAVDVDAAAELAEARASARGVVCRACGGRGVIGRDAAGRLVVRVDHLRTCRLYRPGRPGREFDDEPVD
jgi:hypothetical protein